MKKMNAMVGFLVVLLALKSISAEHTCADNHTCVNIHDCPEFIDLLIGTRILSIDTIKRLTDARCGSQGNEPMVCCAKEKIVRSNLTISTTKAPFTSAPEVVPDPPNVTNHPKLRLLNHDICGPIVQQKIIGGSKTGIFDYPWMALIAYRNESEPPEFRCGGTIISSRYVLTAAHCLTLLSPGLKLTSVRVGDHDISTERDCELDENGQPISCADKYQEFDIESYHFHPGYLNTEMQNDIGLIRLNRSVDFRPLSVKPICLPFPGEIMIVEKKGTVTGWGATDSGMRSNDLLQARMPLMSNQRCREVIKDKPIWYKQICAGGQLNIDTCPGDSGGPLQALGKYNGDNIRTVQYGVVSFGLKQCGTAGYPGVYTRISYYMDWILNTMRD